MNDVWHFLREFESKELVKRYIKNRYDFGLNTSKATEITSAFSQGREYFFNSNDADISVRPLLQYYGVVALSRGLILILNKKARENNITPSHGLKIINWDEVNKSGKVEETLVKTSKGTFTELINVTNNKSYLRAGRSAINLQVHYDEPANEFQIKFGQIAMSFPDLVLSTKSWLNEEIPSRNMNSLKTVDDKIEMKIQGKNDAHVLDKLFPSEIFKDLEIEEKGHECIVKFNSDSMPNFSQKWVGSFKVLGDTCINPPLNNNVFLNDIAKMYCVSFVFGTISRYYPSAWNNIHKGINNDSVLPFALNFMDFLKEKYPQVIMDFLKGPYEFEKE